MPEWLTNIIVAVATGVVAAGVAGWLGVQNALKQLVLQRGRERKLDWYERTGETLGAYLATLQVVRGIQTDGSPIGDSAPHLVTMDEHMSELAGLLHNSRLYAPAELVRLAEAIGAEFGEFGNAMKYTGEGGNALVPLSRVDAHIQRVHGARDMLAKHYRAEVGSDSLDGSSR